MDPKFSRFFLDVMIMCGDPGEGISQVTIQRIYFDKDSKVFSWGYQNRSLPLDKCTNVIQESHL